MGLPIKRGSVALIALSMILFLLNSCTLTGFSIFRGDPTIYGFMDYATKSSNQGEFTFVIGDSPAFETQIAQETEAANRLIQRMESKSLVDASDVQDKNLVVFGNSNVNSLAKKYLGSWNFSEDQTIIALDNSDGVKLFIAGSNAQGTKSAVEFLLNYEAYPDVFNHSAVIIDSGGIRKYTGKLNLQVVSETPESTEITNEKNIEAVESMPFPVPQPRKNEPQVSRAPDDKNDRQAARGEQASNNNFIWLLVLAIMVLLGTVLVIIMNRKGFEKGLQTTEDNLGSQQNASTPLAGRYKLSPQKQAELDDYIKKALNRGFTKNQIMDSFTSAGWPKDFVENELKKY